MSRNIKITIIATSAFVLAVFALSIFNQSQRNSVPSLASLAEQGLVVLSKPRQLGSFNLLDQDGAAFAPQNFSGSWSVVFFGFTHCPDICPTTMSTLRQSMKLLDDKVKSQVKVYLASADPERDRPAVMKRYVSSFADDFIGLTGQHSQLAKFAMQVGATFAKVPLRMSQQHQGHDMHQHHSMADKKADEPVDPNAYTIDHSTQLILLNPKGHFHAYIKAPHTPKHIASTLHALQNEFRF